MDEAEYRRLHGEANPARCVFEKTVLSARAPCAHAYKVCLAEREAVACAQPVTGTVCAEVLALLTEKARFALRRIDDQPLTHGQAMKIQLGGLAALRAWLAEGGGAAPDDIGALLVLAVHRAGDAQRLPYEIMVREIMHTQWRAR